jgi:hypothetical protein
MREITVDGRAYRVVGSLDNGHKLAVWDDAEDVGRVLVRDDADGPWRRWIPPQDEPPLPAEAPADA